MLKSCEKRKKHKSQGGLLVLGDWRKVVGKVQTLRSGPRGNGAVHGCWGNEWVAFVDDLAKSRLCFCGPQPALPPCTRTPRATLLCHDSCTPERRSRDRGEFIRFFSFFSLSFFFFLQKFEVLKKGKKKKTNSRTPMRYQKT